MKKQRKMFLTALVSAAVLSVTVLAGALTAWAGEWTHTSPPSEFFGSSYDESLWYYIKDDGTYAISQWVYDEDDKEWYWLDETGSIPLTAGVADDGDTYNAVGQWIDVTTEGTPYKFITKEDFEKIKEGMTYEEVVDILGAYHEYSSSEETMVGNEKVLVESLTWYTEKAKGYGIVTFKNDIVALALPMFDMNWDF